ncbi:hypothetical protein [Bifidobacterium sp. ESL0790]|uniref:hypothetical protein n=1 Tax=Bifidobacterium sp. ESL0790 TaxID=2983233 RepID=UPI0023F7C43C|nr:hypothetical protein [Bifidobacterium sp. ESL0790]WEV71906.1 hypothetical protein OZY47_05475 [Bifidobacterium sp. ESL0790]
MTKLEIPIQFPLDDDGFLHRECPNCEQEFKWFPTDDDSYGVEQYFCPRCGKAAGLNEWRTPAQIEYVKGVIGPSLDKLVNNSLVDMFKSASNHNIKFEKTGDFTFGIPTPSPLNEPNDMVIVESPCHPDEPIKIPADATKHIFCLICGKEFTA